MFNYHVEIEGGVKILRVNAQNYPRIATIEDDPNVMAFLINLLSKESGFDEIIIDQGEQYVYYKENVKVLEELANLYAKYKSIFSRLLSYKNVGQTLKEQIKIINKFLNNFPRDPVDTFIYIFYLHNYLIKLKKSYPYAEFVSKFIEDFKKTTLYTLLKEEIFEYKGGRDIYRKIFYPDIKPAFIYVKFRRHVPRDWELIETYRIDNFTEVYIYRKEGDILYKYFLLAPEFLLNESDFEILGRVKQVLSSFLPSKEEFSDLESLRERMKSLVSNLVLNIAYDLGIKIDEKRKETLTDIAIRHVFGFGVLELLLKDDRIQDILVNSPVAGNPVFVYHSDYETCETNIMITPREADSWATRLRLISGRPFNEANPILDTELFIENIRTRVSAIMNPLSPYGLAFSFRRHRRRPWTLPLFIKNKMLNSLAAGLLSFLVYNGRTILIAGTRGAGKTSLLTSLMLEIPRRVRIITIEDTLELPVKDMRKLGYNIQSLKVRSPVSISTEEPSAEIGIRVSLRLGDSALIVGEVRSYEAKVLYEAMRVGALANTVMGTIHAESPYGVYDRVVNDLGVPKTSFKATDIIVMVNPIKDPSGMKKYRRVISITEVRKLWEEDPIKENGFVDLMVYDIKKDELYPTINLIHGDSEVLKSLVSRVKIFAKDWDSMWRHIKLRADVKRLLVDIADKTGKYDILEAPFVVKANEAFTNFVYEVYEEIGYPDEKEIYNKFKKWLLEELKNY